MHEDMKDLRNEFESIDIPKELDFVIEKAIRKGRKSIRTKVFKPFAAIAAAMIIFVFTVNVSSAFANLVSKVPGMEGLVKLVRFDKGLVDAANNGIGQVINKSDTKNGITITVESLIFDGRRLMIAYEIKSDKELESLGAPHFELMDSKGKRLEVSSGISSPDDQNSKVFKGLLEFGHEGFVYPEDIVLNCSAIEHIYNAPDGGKRETISGNWSVPFKLDTKLATVEPKSFDLNKDFSIENMKFNIENMKIYPTVIDLKIQMDKNNPLKVTLFKNLRLIDENGNEYKSNSASIGDEYTAHFESNYFINPKKLTLAFDGVYTMPREDKYFIIDIENEKILDDGGYGIEYLRKSLNFNSFENKKELNVWFRINDKEYAKEDNKFLWINQQIRDQAGNLYNVGFLHTMRDKEGINEYAIAFDTEKTTPKVVKVRIDGISKGIMKSVKVTLK